MAHAPFFFQSMTYLGSYMPATYTRANVEVEKWIGEKRFLSFLTRWTAEDEAGLCHQG